MSYAVFTNKEHKFLEKIEISNPILSSTLMDQHDHSLLFNKKK